MKLMKKDPFALLRQMTAELDRTFEETSWPMFRWPALGAIETPTVWAPRVDVLEKNGRLLTKIDLPGLKKEDVKVEILEGQLVISGERKFEKEEKEENFYRCERQYGSFYRAVPLPENVKFEDIKATFADGVLEVSVPVPVVTKPKALKVTIEEAGKRELAHV